MTDLRQLLDEYLAAYSGVNRSLIPVQTDH